MLFLTCPMGYWRFFFGWGGWGGEGGIQMQKNCNQFCSSKIFFRLFEMTFGLVRTYGVDGGLGRWFCGRNPMVWPSKWNVEFLSIFYSDHLWSEKVKLYWILLNFELGAMFVFVFFSCRVTHLIDACPPRWKLIQIREVFIQEAIQDTLTFRWLE